MEPTGHSVHITCRGEHFALELPTFGDVSWLRRAAGDQCGILAPHLMVVEERADGSFTPALEDTHVLEPDTSYRLLPRDHDEVYAVVVIAGQETRFICLKAPARIIELKERLLLLGYVRSASPEQLQIVFSDDSCVNGLEPGPEAGIVEFTRYHVTSP